jgi:hypothetical protein
MPREIGFATIRTQNSTTTPITQYWKLWQRQPIDRDTRMDTERQKIEHIGV